MTIQKRLLVIGLLFVVASVLYGAAKHYSPSLVLYVVEQSLLQKAPSGIGSDSVHARFHAIISAAPDKSSKMKRLLRISEYLEKVQFLNLEQVDQLLTLNEPEKPTSHAFPRVFGTFPAGQLENTRLCRLCGINWNFFS